MVKFIYVKEGDGGVGKGAGWGGRRESFPGGKKNRPNPSLVKCMCSNNEESFKVERKSQ